MIAFLALSLSLGANTGTCTPIDDFHRSASNTVLCETVHRVTGDPTYAGTETASFSFLVRPPNGRAHFELHAKIQGLEVKIRGSRVLTLNAYQRASVSPSATSEAITVTVSSSAPHPEGAIPLSIILDDDVSATFDDVVLLGRNNFGWLCSGVATGPREILTAAHCLPLDVVGVGDGIGHPMARFAIKGAAPDPDARRDIATLTLDRDLPIKAFSPVGTDPSRVAGLVRVVGFGAVDPDGRVGFGRKHYKDLNVPGSLGCDHSSAARTGCAAGIEIVIENAGASDACAGDSGGPLFIQDRGSPTGWRLVALTSRSVQNTKRRCGGGGIYSLVRKGTP